LKKGNLLTAMICFALVFLQAESSFANGDRISERKIKKILKEVKKGKNEGLFKVHKALFDTFLPTIKLNSTRKLRLMVQKRRRTLWSSFSKMESITLAFTVFRDLKLLTSQSIVKIIYKFVTKEEESFTGKRVKALKDLKKLIKSFETRKIRVSVSDLTRQERLKLFEFLVRSPVNLHRHMGFAIRNAYLNYLYKEGLLEALTGIVDDTDMPANPMPKRPFFQTKLKFNQKRKMIEGEIDTIVIGSGIGGSVVASEFQKAGKKVLVLEKGPFVNPGALKTYLNWSFLEGRMPMEDNDGSVMFLNASIVGGGTIINNGFSFPPTLPHVRRTIEGWRKKWLLSQKDARDIWSPANMERAYSWLEKRFLPRVVDDSEVNNNNLLLQRGLKKHLGVKGKKFELFRYRKGRGPTNVFDMKSSVETLLWEGLTDKENPITLLSDAKVTRVLFHGKRGHQKAIGVEFEMVQPRKREGVLIDPYKLKIPIKRRIRVYAKNIILSAGNLGSTVVLKNSGLKNDNIGRGFSAHPYIPVMGEFERDINAFEGEVASIYSDAYMDEKLPELKRGFLLESASSTADIAGLLDASLPRRSLENIKKARKFGGMGVLLIDSVNSKNRIEVKRGRPQVFYDLNKKDRMRLAYGVSEVAKILLKEGAKRVVVLTFEDILGKRSWREGFSVKTLKEADAFRSRLKLIPNKNLLMAAHMLGANKLGVDPSVSVVGQDHQVWGVKGLYVVDSSVLPASPGANPMTTIYAISKLFTESFLRKSF
tara:strand:- start:6 stop:2294 length:2289 start_codon:yes stop_codon:yes gene_type:complete